MSLPSKFINYYELLDVKPDAKLAEIRAGHVHSIARNPSVEHRTNCNQALELLENPEFRTEYDKQLRRWTFDNLKDGRNKAESIVQTVQQAENRIKQAAENLHDAREIIFNCRYQNKSRIRRARNKVHELCREAVRSAQTVRDWSNKVFEACEEVNEHIRATVYLMPGKTKEIETKIRRVERRARQVGSESQEISNEARSLEAEIEGLIDAAPTSGGFVHQVRTTGSTISSVLTWINSTLNTSFNIVKLIGIFIAIFVVLGVVLMIVIFIVSLIAK